MALSSRRSRLKTTCFTKPKADITWNFLAHPHANLIRLCARQHTAFSARSTTRCSRLYWSKFIVLNAFQDFNLLLVPDSHLLYARDGVNKKELSDVTSGPTQTATIDFPPLLSFLSVLQWTKSQVWYQIHTSIPSLLSLWPRRVIEPSL